MLFKQSIKLFTARPPNISNLLSSQTRSRCTSSPEKWDLMAAVCVERHPLITKPKLELEQRVQDVLNEIEFENSMKCDHEMRDEFEKKQEELLKKGIVEVDPDKLATITAQDIEDIGVAELAKFTFASRITEADKSNVKTSLERKLEKCLLLLVQQKVGNDLFWLPPQGVREEGETLRQSAERVLRAACGEDLTAKIYGNAPIGFYKYTYPKVVREKGSRGAKIFYYLARYMDGNVQDKVKYQWLDRQELAATLPKPIHKSVSMFLVPE